MVKHECDDVEEFRSGRWSGGEHKMVTPPDPKEAPTPTSSAPVTTTKAAAPASPPAAPTPSADLSGGGKHEADGS